MSTLAIALTMLLCALGAALAGLLLHARLRERYLDADSKDVVKGIMGLVATMTALVLGLLIASAQSSYRAQDTNLQKMAGDILQLDHLLVFYGPEAEDARDQLREAVAAALDAIWSPNGVKIGSLGSLKIQARSESILAAIQQLSPKTDAQRFAQSQALQLALRIGGLRELLAEAQSNSAISWLFLAALVFWVSALFLGFGFIAPFHAANTLALSVGALSVSLAI